MKIFSLVIVCLLFCCFGCRDDKPVVKWCTAHAWSSRDHYGERIDIEFGFGDNGHMYWRFEQQGD